MKLCLSGGYMVYVASVCRLRAGNACCATQSNFSEDLTDLIPHLPLPAGIDERIDKGVRESQQPEMVLQKVIKFTFRTRNLHNADHEEGAPAEREAADKHGNGPQGFYVTPVTAGGQKTRSRLPAADALLVPAGDFQDVHVEINEDAE